MLKIVIKGPPQSGKTTLAEDLGAWLTTLGYAVTLEDGDGYPHDVDGYFKGNGPRQPASGTQLRIKVKQ